jgi:hypothetical protein
MDFSWDAVSAIAAARSARPFSLDRGPGPEPFIPHRSNEGMKGLIDVFIF